MTTVTITLFWQVVFASSEHRARLAANDLASLADGTGYSSCSTHEYWAKAYGAGPTLSTTDAKPGLMRAYKTGRCCERKTVPPMTPSTISKSTPAPAMICSPIDPLLESFRLC